MTGTGHDGRLVLVGGPRLAWRDTGDEIVVLDVQACVYFGLNASASRLWKRLAEGTSLGELTRTLTSTARVAPDRALADVEEFLRQLDSYGLLREEPAS